MIALLYKTGGTVTKLKNLLYKINQVGQVEQNAMKSELKHLINLKFI